MLELILEHGLRVFLGMHKIILMFMIGLLACHREPPPAPNSLKIVGNWRLTAILGVPLPAHRQNFDAFSIEFVRGGEYRLIDLNQKYSVGRYVLMNKGYTFVFTPEVFGDTLDILKLDYQNLHLRYKLNNDNPYLDAGVNYAEFRFTKK